MTMDLRLIRVVRGAVRASVLATVVIASGCGSGNVGVEPAIGSVNPIANSKLQFAVGVATINDVSHSKVVETLNTVETLRQPDGLSAVLYSIPYITGPPGFIGQPDPILGNPTTIISGSGPKIPCNKTTLQCTGGAFGYGFAPDNTVPGQQAVSFAEYFQPVAVGNQDQLPILPYYGGGSSAARPVAGNDFMYWAVMEAARERGVKIFDYGRSKRGTGAFEFKEHWGFEPEPLHYEYYLVEAQSLPNLSPTNPKYKRAIELWRRLPLPITQLIGPAAARWLG